MEASTSDPDRFATSSTIVTCYMEKAPNLHPPLRGIDASTRRSGGVTSEGLVRLGQL